MRTLTIRLLVVLVVAISFATRSAISQNEAREAIEIDGAAPAHPFPHFWEQMFGSGRAILSLRAGYRDDLRAVHEITGFQYVRFHAILDDDVGVYDENGGGDPIYNFSYVDQIYDGLLAQGVRPFVELSFMPNKLAAAEHFQAFWYKPDVSPPKDWNRWDGLITALTQHLVDRYGASEVGKWYFEVWNEPNIDFWAGEPKQPTYFDLYDHTALAIKKVNASLRVGGPATAQAAWVGDFIRHCVEKNIPVDFVSTHVYGNDTSMDVFHTHESIPRNQMVCRAVSKVHDEIAASPKPRIPLIWSEFNASYKNEPDVTDSTYMGPWLAETLQQCDGLVDIMSYWTFSDVFEEQGVVKTPFYGGYGLIAAGSIPKPAFGVFQLLHKLGGERLQLASDSALVTRSRTGVLTVAAWNYDAPGESGAEKTVVLHFKNVKASHARIWRVDSDHGDFHKAYAQMHEPRYPTQAEISRLRAAAKVPAAEDVSINDDRLRLAIPPQGLVVIEVW